MVTRALYKAREQFVTEGHIRHDLRMAVSPDVLRSWRRSKLSGVRAEVPGLPLLVEEEASESPLTLAAEPILARLAEQFAGLGAGVLLSDRNARIVRRWAPDLRSLERMDRTCSAAGASGSEAMVGTNGIGTVAEERRARMVVGPEHFAEVFTDHACIGAPIHHPVSRRFEGVVTVSAAATVASPLLLPLVVTTAHQVEERLLAQSSRREQMLLEAFLSASRRGSAVAVIGEGVFMVGPRASRLLRGVDLALVWPRLREEVSGRARRTAVLDVGDGSVVVTADPLTLDGHLIGAILDVMAEPAGDVAVAVGAPGAAGAAVLPRAAESRVAWAEARRSLPGASQAWTAVLGAAADQIGQSLPLLVTGEAGTGKQTLARLIHLAGGRPADALDVVDAAAPDAAAVLGAAIGRPDPGPVLLLHVEALSRPAAATVAAQLETGVERGDQRIVATSAPIDPDDTSPGHRRLLDLVAVARIDLPPLRRRSEDIPELVDHLASEGRPAADPLRPGLRFTAQAMIALQRAPWPGNVRQLAAVVRGLAAGAPGREIGVEMLPAEVAAHVRRRPLAPMEQLELDAILAALRRTRGNKVQAAQALGISRSTLYRKMTSYQLDPDHHYF